MSVSRARRPTFRVPRARRPTSRVRWRQLHR